MSSIAVIEADLGSTHHANAILGLLNEYALDPMGGGVPLPAFTQDNLIHALADQAGVCILLAESNAALAGLLIAFPGFSTFACKPLLNIHDIVVSPAFRGQGIAHRLLQEAQRVAQQRGCCKLTLEVLEGNSRAQAIYRRFGFTGYELDPQMGNAVFWQKKL